MCVKIFFIMNAFDSTHSIIYSVSALLSHLLKAALCQGLCYRLFIMRKNKKNHDPIYAASFDQGWIGIVTRISTNNNSNSDDSSSSYSTNNSSRNTMLSEGDILSGSSESDNESQYSITAAVAVAASGEEKSHDGSDVAVASTLQYYDRSVEDEDDEDHDQKSELFSDDDSPPT